ncbi:signal peptidase I [Halostagnicola bangensis]
MSRGISKRRALHVSGVVLFVALLVPFLVFAVPDVAGADESYVVLSDSMNPTIDAGDVVIVQERDPSSIEEGDVLTFDAADPDEFDAADGTSIVTHRVVDIEQADDGLEFVTQGDANNAPDSSAVDEEQVIGTVAFSIPSIGRVVSFAGTRTGLALFVVVPCALLVVNELYELTVSDEGGES